MPTQLSDSFKNKDIETASFEDMSHTLKVKLKNLEQTHTKHLRAQTAPSIKWFVEFYKWSVKNFEAGVLGGFWFGVERQAPD